MKKIPSLFLRDWEKNRSLVTEEINPECEWVFEGVGKATRKWDGTSCMVREGKLYRRYEAKFDKKKGIWKTIPEGFEPCQEPDEKTGHQPGWIPVKFDDYKTKQEKSDNFYFKMAWNLIDIVDSWTKGNFYNNCPNPKYEDGTYELCGIVINGNPERLNGLYFIKHDYMTIYRFSHEMHIFLKNFPLTYERIKKSLEDHYMEGIVWHHPDGRMSKIKRIDFGLKWG